MGRTVKPKHLPAKLLAIRKHLRLSQSRLAQRFTLKTHYGRISEFELGKRTPNLVTLLDYARVAGTHIDDLVDDAVDLTRFHEAPTGRSQE